MLPPFDAGELMTTLLTAESYEQTREKLSRLEHRLAKLSERSDMAPLHHAEARKSYLRMIGQYKREIKLYEANRAHSTAEVES